MGYKGLRKLAVNAELGGTIDLVIGESTAKAPLASRSLRPVDCERPRLNSGWWS